jgi:hypothetical protein
VSRAAVWAAFFGAWLALTVATFPASEPSPAQKQGVVEVPCQPVTRDGRPECTWRVDADVLDGARVVYLGAAPWPTPGPSADVVRRQIRGLHGRTP